jgi:hypothetical protein
MKISRIQVQHVTLPQSATWLLFSLPYLSSLKYVWLSSFHLRQILPRSLCLSCSPIKSFNLFPYFQHACCMLWPDDAFFCLCIERCLHKCRSWPKHTHSIICLRLVYRSFQFASSVTCSEATYRSRYRSFKHRLQHAGRDGNRSAPLLRGQAGLIVSICNNTTAVQPTLHSGLYCSLVTDSLEHGTYNCTGP